AQGRRFRARAEAGLDAGGGVLRARPRRGQPRPRRNPLRPHARRAGRCAGARPNVPGAAEVRGALRLDVEARRPFRVIVRSGTSRRPATFYPRLLGMPGRRTILARYDAVADGDPEPVGPNLQNLYLSV